MAFLKTGDLHPITVVDPIDMDDNTAKKSLKKAIRKAKAQQKIIVDAKEAEKN
jgi:hypothetical protein